MSGKSTREALQRAYPGADVRARREFGGGITASVHTTDGTLGISAEIGGLVAFLLGLDVPDRGTGNGGEALSVTCMTRLH